jgi:hypothetical protein
MRSILRDLKAVKTLAEVDIQQSPHWNTVSTVLVRHQCKSGKLNTYEKTDLKFLRVTVGFSLLQKIFFKNHNSNQNIHSLGTEGNAVDRRTPRIVQKNSSALEKILLILLKSLE